ncbi:MAG: 6-phosphofructokinase [Bdellovibrionales bacterium]|nr:6-phosphofructokinase [Bdellovibrionales bacterium]
MRIGLMTGGGDAPGLNGIIESASRTLIGNGHTVLGILDGFDGVFTGRTREIKWSDILGIHCDAGTFLGTSSKTKVAGRGPEFQAQFAKLNLDGLIAAGGDGTFIGLQKIAPNLPIVGVPKTIDNDVPGTEITFGYDTACTVVADAVDALRKTADAHRRVMVVETMGRTAGWIALGGGLASYADAILLPERPFNREGLKQFLTRRRTEGLRGMVIVVSEAAKGAGEDAVYSEAAGAIHTVRFGGVGERLARWIEQNTAWEARHVVLGHLQRSREPTTTDRFLTASMGIKAAQLAMEKKWGTAVTYRGGRVVEAPLTDIQGPPRLIDPDHRWVKHCQSLGIFI